MATTRPSKEEIAERKEISKRIRKEATAILRKFPSAATIGTHPKEEARGFLTVSRKLLIDAKKAESWNERQRNDFADRLELLRVSFMLGHSERASGEPSTLEHTDVPETAISLCNFDARHCFDDCAGARWPKWCKTWCSIVWVGCVILAILDALN